MLRAEISTAILICSLLNCPCNSECVEASDPFDSVCLCNEGFFELDGECVGMFIIKEIC